MNTGIMCTVIILTKLVTVLQKNCIINSATKTIPNKIITLRPNDPPWMHNNIRKSIRARKRLHFIAKTTNSPYDWAKYRKIRNVCVNKIRNAKQTYITIRFRTY